MNLLKPSLNDLIVVNSRLEDLTNELNMSVSLSKSTDHINMIRNQIELAKYVRRQYLSVLMA